MGTDAGVTLFAAEGGKVGGVPSFLGQLARVSIKSRERRPALNPQQPPFRRRSTSPLHIIVEVVERTPAEGQVQGRNALSGD